VPAGGDKPVEVPKEKDGISAEQERKTLAEERADNSKEAPESWKRAWDIDAILPTDEKIDPTMRKVGDKKTGGIIVRAPGKNRDIDLSAYMDPPPPAPPVPDEKVKYDKMSKIPGAEISLGVNMVRGNSASDFDTKDHKVTVKTFWIDQYEVTNADYKKFVETTGHRKPSHWLFGDIPPGKNDHPVAYVSWHDAAAYAKWVGKRLPTEAEWELAARSTDGRTFPWGRDFDAKKCNTLEGNISDTVSAFPEGDYKQGGPYTVYHMAGNVMEWVEDDYGPYPNNNFSSYQKYYEEKGKYKVLRGGSFAHESGYARTYARFFDKPDVWYCCYYGFRCAQDDDGSK
jgi:formylglycine-generating enzyme required for sulfatase activity